MIQVYFLSVCYLFFGALLLLLPSYKVRLFFLLGVKNRIKEDRRIRMALFIAGLVLFLLQLFFPIAPGPRFLGDLVPAFTTLYVAFWIVKSYRHEKAEDVIAAMGEGQKSLGFSILSLAVVHFLVPMCVLL